MGKLIIVTWTSIFSFGIFILLMISLFKKGTDVFSPGRLFMLIWTFAIGLTDLKLSRYQYFWSDYSWIMITLALVSMLLGMFVIYVVNYDKSLLEISTVRKKFIDGSFNSGLLFKYTLFLSGAYFISYVVSVIVIGYVPLFTKFPGVARNDWGIFGFGLFVQSFPSIVYLGILYFIITKKNVARKYLVGAILLAVFLTYAFLLQRYYIVFAILIISISLYYLTNLLRPKNILIITIVIFISVFSMTFIRLTGTIANYLYYLSQMKYSIKYAVFTEPYMYIVMNLENFANAVDKLDKFTYGAFTFDFIFALSGLKHSLVEYLHLPQFPFLISNNFNTYTMFFIYYWDYGILGLGLIPFALGAIISSAFYKMRRDPTIHSVAIYSILAFVIIFSFFVPIVSFLHFVFNFFVIHYVTKRILSE